MTTQPDEYNLPTCIEEVKEVLDRTKKNSHVKK